MAFHFRKTAVLMAALVFGGSALAQTLEKRLMRAV